MFVYTSNHGFSTDKDVQLKETNVSTAVYKYSEMVMRICDLPITRPPEEVRGVVKKFLAWPSSVQNKIKIVFATEQGSEHDMHNMTFGL